MCPGFLDWDTLRFFRWNEVRTSSFPPFLFVNLNVNIFLTPPGRLIKRRGRDMIRRQAVMSRRRRASRFDRYAVNSLKAVRPQNSRRVFVSGIFDYLDVNMPLRKKYLARGLACA